MNWEYIHLVAHSFPIVLSVTGTLVGLYGWGRNREQLELWGLVALLIAGAFVAPAYLTGLAAADVVGQRTFVQPGTIQSHRFAATWAAIPVFTAGALAAFSLHERDDRRLRHFVFVMGLIAAAAVGYAAWVGSRITHGEGARTAAAAAIDQPGVPAATDALFEPGPPDAAAEPGLPNVADAATRTPEAGCAHPDQHSPSFSRSPAA